MPKIVQRTSAHESKQKEQKRAFYQKRRAKNSQNKNKIQAQLTKPDFIKIDFAPIVVIKSNNEIICSFCPSAAWLKIKILF